MKRNKFQESLVYYDRVLSIEPENPIAWSFKGTSLLNLRRYRQAREALRKFVEYASPHHAKLAKQAKDLIADIDEIIMRSGNGQAKRKN